MGGQTTDKQSDTLYERLGGDPFINLLTCAFFDELVENPDLAPFFKYISKSALKCHQVKLFRVIFGKEEEKPENEDLLEFMLRTHTRLFRDLGLDASHFDMVATCFVQGLETFQVRQSLIDECVAILVPLRVVFEYGAQVAAKEKEMTEQELQELPKANPKTIGTDVPVVLPEYSTIDVPDWLPATLGKESNSSNVRRWTCDLTDRFGAEGDAAIADTFMDQPYMDHHVYLVAFLELAFLPEGQEDDFRERALGIVLFPRGRKKSRLSQELFLRMIAQFRMTCHTMGMSTFAAKAAESKLLTFRDFFAEDTTLVGGINAPHILKKRRRKKRGASKKKAMKDESKRSAGSTGPLVSLTLFDDSETDSVCSRMSGFSHASSVTGKSGSSRSPRKNKMERKKSWSMFGWIRASKKKQAEPAIPTSIAT